MARQSVKDEAPQNLALQLGAFARALSKPLPFVWRSEFCERLLEAWGAGGGRAGFSGHVRRCARSAEAQLFEVNLAEGHHAGVEITPNEEQQERDRGVVFHLRGVECGGREVNSE